MDSIDKMYNEIKVPKYDVDYYLDENYDDVKRPILKFNGFTSPKKYSEHLTNIRSEVIKDIKLLIFKKKNQDRISLLSNLNQKLSELSLIKISYKEEIVNDQIKISHIYARDQYLADFNTFIPQELSSGLSTYYKIQLEVINSIVREIELLIENNNQMELQGDRKLLSFKLIGEEGKKYQDRMAKLKELFDQLKDDKYIDINTSFPTFRKVFNEQEITSKIIWHGKIGGLCYFIKELINREKIKNVKVKWQITCSCFIIPGEELTPETFHGTPKPSKRRINEINKAIDSLD